MRARVAAAAFVATLASCAFDPVALEGKRCPCAVGWVCDVPTNRCVEELAERDAGRDAARPRDAGPFAMDARGIDAPPTLDGGRGTDAPPGVDAPSGIDAPPGVDAPRRVDAGPDETACDDALASAMFCDGFEADDGLAAWTMTTGSGATVARTTAVAFRGAASLVARSTTDGGYLQLKHDFGPVTSGEMWMRGYVRVPATSTINHLDTMFLRSSTPPGYEGLVVTLASELRPFLWVSEIASGYSAPDPVARDRWTCIEVHTVIGNSGSATMYVDGAAVASGTGIDTSPPDGYGLFAVGITWASMFQGPTELYFDEVAIGRTRLPCD